MSDEKRDVERKMDAELESSSIGAENNVALVEASTSTDNQPSVAVAAAGPSNEQPLARIFNMNIDCFEELFEFFSVKDLFVLRLVCKPFKNRVDYFIKQYYPGVKLSYEKVDISLDVENIRCLDPSLARLIKSILLLRVYLSEENVNCLKVILSQVEEVIILSTVMLDDFYESFYQFCLNVKRLWIICGTDDKLMGTSDEWLHRRYPKLQYVEFMTTLQFPQNLSISGVKTFFELNPQIHTFATSIELLNACRSWCLESRIKFDVLKIETGFLDNKKGYDYSRLIRTLHEQGFYQRLHLQCREINSDIWCYINPLPAVEILHFGERHNSKFIDTFVLPPSWTSLKELSIRSHVNNTAELACSLTNVERVYVYQSKLSGIMPLIRHSVKLKVIRVYRFTDIPLPNGIIDVVALNKERNELAGACRLTIYVSEKLFLATKWAGMATDCSLVTLKREQAFNIHVYDTFMNFVKIND